MRFWSNLFVKLHKKTEQKLYKMRRKRQIEKKVKKTLKKVLTKGNESGIIYKLSRRADSEVIEN